ncbi:hypothetical protein GCM10010978_15950 [Compostibacillus humi]|uniref:Prepilin-type N-terminal cleavage/methylation domain-containing protein n=1 Tax=Compostibacillus humi TaxID=1245525 RepID=A0A8J3ELB7_9BACI|nr:hypothetical protein [Compostibacillus humi]GGH75766.1 hypothetical protein GCM10010978_15950 [Compostibacillus humi]
MKKLLTSSKGLTLVELLSSFTILSIITIIIMNYLLGGMNSYEKTSKDVSLHNDANYVMSAFVRHIYEGTEVEIEESTSDSILIKVTNLSGEETILGFKNHQAYIKSGPNESKSLSHYQFPCCGNDASNITVKNDTVIIKMMIEDQKSETSLELKNEVSFRKPAEEMD